MDVRCKVSVLSMAARNAFYVSAAWRELRAFVLKRDKYRCVTPGCGATGKQTRLFVDHIEARPAGAVEVTEFDVPGNLRTLCAACDARVKEHFSGTRRNGGNLVARGCDINGVPLDPKHHWRTPA